MIGSGRKEKRVCYIKILPERSGQPQCASTLTRGCFSCARDVRDVASSICARPTSTDSTCSSEEDAKSRQEGVKEEAATMKTAREGPVATCGPGHRETGLGEPRTKNIDVSEIPHKDLRVCCSEDGSGQREQDCRVACVIFSAQMDNLNVYTHGDRLPSWSLWGRCAASGRMWQAWFVHHRSTQQ